MGFFFNKIWSLSPWSSQLRKYSGNYLARNSLLLFGIQCGSIGLVFLSNFVLVRIAGAAVYGSYVYLFNLIYLLSVFCIMGMDTLLVRKISIYHSNGNFDKLKGLLAFSGVALALGVLLVATLFLGISEYSSIAFTKNKWVEWIFAIASLGMLSLTTLAQSVLQGMKKIATSQLGEKIFRPLFLILSVLFVYLWDKRFNLTLLVWANVLAIAVSMLFALFASRAALYGVLKSVIATFERKNWQLAAGAFFIADILYNGNARIGIYLLGLIKSKQDVGVYNISLRISELINFAMVVVNFVLSPLIARLFAEGDRTTLQRTITSSSRVIMAIGSILFLAIVFFRIPILRLFGMEFEAGSTSLVILCTGQWINVFFGSVGTLLIMTGHQRYSIAALSTGILINIGLNIWLTPLYGITGTAIASAASVGGWNLVMYYFVRKKLQIYPTAFGIF